MRLIPSEALERVCSKIRGSWGLYVSIPQSGEQFSLQAQTRFVSASTIKIPLLALLLQDGETGRLDLNLPITISKENRVGGSGILQSLHDTVSMSLLDYAELMMVLSDNIATNQIIDAVGMERANAFFAQHGWSATHLGRKMMTPGILLPDGTREQNYTSAEDLGHMLEAILAGTLVSKDTSRIMRQIMAGQRGGKFASSLPVETRPDPTQPLTPAKDGRLLLISKGGTLLSPTVIHDTAIFMLPNGLNAVLVLMTASENNDETAVIMGQAAKILYDALKTC